MIYSIAIAKEPCACGASPSRIDTAKNSRTGKIRAYCMACQRLGPDSATHPGAIRAWDVDLASLRAAAFRAANPGAKTPEEKEAAWAKRAQEGKIERPWP